MLLADSVIALFCNQYMGCVCYATVAVQPLQFNSAKLALINNLRHVPASGSNTSASSDESFRLWHCGASHSSLAVATRLAGVEGQRFVTEHTQLALARRPPKHIALNYNK
jgi:hypothetical protein